MKTFETVGEKFNNDNIKIDEESSQIWIQIQDGPIKEVGVNGEQIDMIGKIWLEIIKEFNLIYPCEENKQSIKYIEEALMWQHKRTINRTKRGVEGLNKP